jgi:hypothetical protein
MVSNHPHPRLRSSANLVVLRLVLEWQMSGYDSWLCCDVLPLANLLPREFVFFTYYIAARLVPPVSSFLLTLLEFYRIQLQHLSPHSYVLVAVFVHFCEMFVGAWPPVPLFRLFHVLCWAEKATNPIGTYYFQLRAKGLVAYIMAVTPADAHDRLVLPSGAPTGHCDLWEEPPKLLPAFTPVI